MTGNPSRIGAIVLTHNSTSDLSECLTGLIAQSYVDLKLIVVDNASRPEERARMEADFLAALPEGRVLAVADANPAVVAALPAVFLRSESNGGYSAGNNIGARLAVAAGCEAVLVANPDVRITDSDYLSGLWAEMQSVPDCVVGASRLVNLFGQDEHPLRETGFWEELLWIRQLGPRMLRPAPKVLPPTGSSPVEAEKLHGSCLLIRSQFLQDTDFFDESVFLYSEEPILAARVRGTGGRMMVFPKFRAVHAHVASAKGNSSRRMLQFITSRLYYLDNYTNYSPVKRGALRISYSMLAGLHMIRAGLRHD
ncbi:glycosyltransferase family 2 protein [Arsenicitalea aurantiaca]|uniref:Glycosyltransferase family 2 protein n=1 Tax=Arsenicitalea aurantiaca TaxID=1783274 RepID=A0A433X7F1_9HYPH|nr:glycosyltransferase family 2 protein [Arsenicitalea aurantiaca]RUT29973.1 glycosyltransferase family 2 protein [Arsenicitalea aurantiaca]